MAAVVPYLGYIAVGLIVGGGVYAASRNRTQLPGVDLDEMQQTAKEGEPRVQVWGTVRPIKGNIVAAEDPPRIVRRRQSGGKGGSSPRSEHPYRTYAVGVCEGPITGYGRIWRNNKLMYDGRPDSSWGASPQFEGFEEGGSSFVPIFTTNNDVFLRRATLYLGGYDQMPDPALEQIFGVGQVPAMRGTAYMVIEDEDLTDMNGAVPQWTFEVEVGDPVESSELAMAHSSSPRVTRLGVGDWETLPNILSSGSTTASGVEFTRDMAHMIASLNSNPRLRVVRMSDLAEVSSQNLGGNSTGGLDRSPNGMWVAIAGVGAQRIYVLDTDTWDLQSPTTPSSNAREVAFSPDSSVFALAHNYWFANPLGPTNLTVYDAESGFSISAVAAADPASSSNHGLCVAWAPTGDRIYFGQAQGDRLRAVSYPDMAPVSVPEYAVDVNAVHVSPDGQWLAVGHGEEVDVWRIADWTLVASFDDPRSNVVSVRFSVGGAYLAYGAIGTLNPRLFIRRTSDWGEEIEGGRNTPGAVQQLRWSPF